MTEVIEGTEGTVLTEHACGNDECNTDCEVCVEQQCARCQQLFDEDLKANLAMFEENFGPEMGLVMKDILSTEQAPPPLKDATIHCHCSYHQ